MCTVFTFRVISYVSFFFLKINATSIKKYLTLICDGLYVFSPVVRQFVKWGQLRVKKKNDIMVLFSSQRNIFKKPKTNPSKCGTTSSKNACFIHIDTSSLLVKCFKFNYDRASRDKSCRKITDEFTFE